MREGVDLMLEENLGLGSAEVVTFFSMHPESSRELAQCRLVLHAGNLPHLNSHSLSHGHSGGFWLAAAMLQRAPCTCPLCTLCENYFGYITTNRITR